MSAREILVDGVLFPSARAAAQFHEVAPSTVTRWVESGRASYTDGRGVRTFGEGSLCAWRREPWARAYENKARRAERDGEWSKAQAARLFVAAIRDGWISWAATSSESGRR